MPKYALFREYPPALTRTELDAMVLASGAALESYIYRGEDQPTETPHGISWIRSYWQRGGTWGMCVFEAPNLSVLSAFQDLCATPFVDAMEIDEAAGNERAPTPVAATISLKADVVTDPLAATREVLGDPAVTVGRVYWNVERKIAVSMLEREPASKSDGVKVEAGLVEVRPDEYS